MPLKPGIDSALEALVGQVADDFLTRQERGERPDIEEYAAAHPEAAEEIRNALRLLVAIGTPPGEGDEEPPLRGTLGDFRILREVGRGGMGVVYEAWQLSLDRQVALKVLPFAGTMDDRQLQRFKIEARAAASLHHEHLVPVYAVGCERGMHFYAMQFIDGLTLAQVIARHNTASEPTTAHVAGAADSTARPAATQVPRDAAYFRRVAQWGVQAAEALEYAHSMGIVHRDIKPGNLMIDGAGKLWVTDFGLARMAADSDLTVSGDLVGTLRYMSPEQAMARHGLVDHRTDVYSLGATLYELLTGRPALTGQDRQELLKQIAFEEPVAPRKVNRHVPAELETIVRKCLEKNPADRFVTAKEVAYDLGRWLEDRPIKARPPSWRKRVSRVVRRHWAVASTAAVGFLLAVTVLAGSIGWVAGEQRARRAETGRVVAAALDEAKEWLRKDRPYEALSAALRAEGMLRQAGGHPEYLAPVGDMLWDVRLLLRLELARLSYSAVRNGAFDSRVADEDYEKAFKEFGLDFLVLSLDQVAEHFRPREIRIEVAAFLDHWASVRSVRRADRGVPTPGWRQLLELAQKIDPDEARGRVRDAVARHDLKELERLTEAGGLEGLASISLSVLVPRAIEVRFPSQLVDVLRRAQQRRPADFWLNWRLAEVLQHQRPSHLEEAIGYYRAAIALRPESCGATSNLGAALMENGKLDEAMACFQKAVLLKPNEAELHDNLGSVLCMKGKIDEGITCFRQAIRLKPELANAHWNLGHVLLKQDKVDEAITCFRQAILLKPDDADAHDNLGLALLKQDKVDEAITCFRQAILLKPDFAGAHHYLGAALSKKGKLDEAITYFRQAICLKPDDADAHYNIGLTLLKQDKVDEAITCFRQAILLKPDFAGAHHDLGGALSDKGRTGEALACYQKAIRLKPGDAAIQNDFGLALQANGKQDEAIVCYREAIRLKPELAIAHLNLGLALAIQGKLDEAMTCTQKAILLDPDDGSAHHNLGIWLDMQDKVDEAITCFRQAIRLMPDFAGAHHDLGNALVKKGKLEEAIAAHKQALVLNANYDEAHCNLGDIFRMQGRFEESLAAFRRGHALGVKQPAWHNPSAHWVQEVERLVKLDQKFSAVLAGQQQAADTAERLALAQLCLTYKRRYLTSARLYAEAFNADPGQAAVLNSHRYNAACAAALAGGGQGEDATGLTAAERTAWRRQALTWLRADLALLSKQVQEGPAAARQQARATLAQWRKDADFAGVRDEKALAELAAEEAQAWRKLWANVDALGPRESPPQPR